jgi:hypothetical protein
MDTLIGIFLKSSLAITFDQCVSEQWTDVSIVANDWIKCPMGRSLSPWQMLFWLSEYIYLPHIYSWKSTAKNDGGGPKDKFDANTGPNWLILPTKKFLFHFLIKPDRDGFSSKTLD